VLPGLLRALADCEDVRLDDRPVRTAPEPFLPRAVVEDRGDGFVVSLDTELDIERRFNNGVALVEGALRPLGDPHLSVRERQELQRGRWFAPGDVAQLVAEVLPGLERRIPVEVRTDRLPTAKIEPPRLRVVSTRDGDRLRVRGDIVYGDPARARIEGERLVHLEGSVPLRNAAAEQRLAARLRRELGLKPGQEQVLEVAAALELAPRILALDDVEILGDVAAFREVGTLAPEFEPGQASFELRFALEGHPDAQPAAVLRAWQAGAGWVGLGTGGFARLPAAWLEAHAQRVADLLAARDASGRLPTWSLPDLGRLCEELGVEPPASSRQLRALLEDFDGLPRAEPPDDLQAELRDYQRSGVDWLCFLRDAGLGGLLADDMGLGKTLQALCSLRGRALVVAPTSVLHAWQTQVERFRPDLRTSVYHGSGRALDPAADLTLTTYAILRLERETLCAVDWDAVVLDEAQAIKNPDSQVARAAFSLRAAFRLTLTGTPVENRLEELWSQLHFANPGLLGSRADFSARYVRPIGEGVPGAAAWLRQRIAPFVLRREKSQVARELPPRTEVELRCPLSEPQRHVYQAVLAATRRELVERIDAGASSLDVLEGLLRLRQAACHPGLVPGQSEGPSGKLDVLLDSLETGCAGAHRALVFSQWTALLDRVEPRLRAAGIAFARLDGSTRDRGAVIERFQDPQGPPVLLISLRAGGTGLNLTAADHVYLLDPWWNPAVETQAADRAHRIGQTQPVVVHRLVAEDTVEERILELQEKKRALAETALGDAQRAVSITKQELLALIE
jgi:superfamily II DNA or RNA helicase